MPRSPDPYTSPGPPENSPHYRNVSGSSTSSVLNRPRPKIQTSDDSNLYSVYSSYGLGEGSLPANTDAGVAGRASNSAEKSEKQPKTSELSLLDLDFDFGGLGGDLDLSFSLDSPSSSSTPKAPTPTRNDVASTQKASSSFRAPVPVPAPAPAPVPSLVPSPLGNSLRSSPSPSTAPPPASFPTSRREPPSDSAVGRPFTAGSVSPVPRPDTGGTIRASPTSSASLTSPISPVSPPSLGRKAPPPLMSAPAGAAGAAAPARLRSTRVAPNYGARDGHARNGSAYSTSSAYSGNESLHSRNGSGATLGDSPKSGDKAFVGGGPSVSGHRGASSSLAGYNRNTSLPGYNRDIPTLGNSRNGTSHDMGSNGIRRPDAFSAPSPSPSPSPSILPLATSPKEKTLPPPPFNSREYPQTSTYASAPLHKELPLKHEPSELYSPRERVSSATGPGQGKLGGSGGQMRSGGPAFRSVSSPTGYEMQGRVSERDNDVPGRVGGPSGDIPSSQVYAPATPSIRSASRQSASSVSASAPLKKRLAAKLGLGQAGSDKFRSASMPDGGSSGKSLLKGLTRSKLTRKASSSSANSNPGLSRQYSLTSLQNFSLKNRSNMFSRRADANSVSAESVTGENESISSRTSEESADTVRGSGRQSERSERSERSEDSQLYPPRGTQGAKVDGKLSRDSPGSVSRENTGGVSRANPGGVSRDKKAHILPPISSASHPETPAYMESPTHTATASYFNSEPSQVSGPSYTHEKRGAATNGYSSSPSAEGTDKVAYSDETGHTHTPPLTSPTSASSSYVDSAWVAVENALESYTAAQSTSAFREATPQAKEAGMLQTNIIIQTLLPFLRSHADLTDDPSLSAFPTPTSSSTTPPAPPPVPPPSTLKHHQNLIFRWIKVLSDELTLSQPLHRGACLEAVALMTESPFMSEESLGSGTMAETQFKVALIRIVHFAIDKLNDKAVYANTLVFSGRILALAFFRIEGVALRLLNALPPIKKGLMARLLEEAGVDPLHLPPADTERFPRHLHPLCLTDFASYVALFWRTPVHRQPPAPYLIDEGELRVEMSGNWLIRWTASDSDLPFAFYRSYFRLLSFYLVPPSKRAAIRYGTYLPATAALGAPGFLFVAASVLEKTDSLIHRTLRSVTSMGPASNAFNTNDSATVSFGQKPKALELANRRIVSTILETVGGPPPDRGDLATIPAELHLRRYVYGGMLPVWLRACVKRTSMYDTRSVFILLDLLEGLIYTLSYPACASRDAGGDDIVVPVPHEACLDLFDLPFLFATLRMLLTEADNTITVMRTIAFIYAHFEIFTLRRADRDVLCQQVILDERIFMRLYLHWNAGVRGYFIRLLVWRLARLSITQRSSGGSAENEKNPELLRIYKLMNVRLESIRKRHDELEPVLDDSEEDALFHPKRSTICSTRGVKEAPFTVSQLSVQEVVEEEEEAGDETNEGTSDVTNDVTSEASYHAEGALDTRYQGSTLASTSASAPANGTHRPGFDGQGAATYAAAHTPSLTRPSRLPPADSLRSSTSSPTGVSKVVSWFRGGLNNRKKTENATKIITTRSAEPAQDKTLFSFELEAGLSPSPSADRRVSLASLSSGSSSPPLSPSNSATFTISSALQDSVYPDASNLVKSPSGFSAEKAHRVSRRFSKRQSILPPTALDLFKESGEAVPSIPVEFLSAEKPAYEEKLHPYAVRGLRDYEDALEEWSDWVVRLQSEEDGGKVHDSGFVDIVPRLAVSWPLDHV